MEQITSMEAARLCAAADALLSALESADGINATVEVFEGDASDEGACREGPFTAAEFSEAMSLLVRLGVVIGPVWSGESCERPEND